ncbi:MAG: galactose mutarotase [Lachnospiraceae bacterium]|nr:galactose mutarotase [Lachnospiraceae bacterium]
MNVTKSFFGNTPAGDVDLYTLTNRNEMSVQISSLGAALVSIKVPDKDGKAEDVLLGYDTALEYYERDGFLGAVVGPVANRIAGAEFELEGKVYHLQANDGPNNLHSHFELGYHRRIWSVKESGGSLLFSLTDEEQTGFPGKKTVTVEYTLTDQNELKIHYHLSSDENTPVNLTNHSYFNLDGHDSGSVLDHRLTLNASRYTEVREGAIPTGMLPVAEGTVMDFTKGRVIGDDIEADFEQLKLTIGYDHNWVIDGWDGSLRHFATLVGKKSGRIMEAYTTLPGVQFYAGNYLDGRTGKNGAKYFKRQGLCLETQYFPDSVHHDNFPSCIFGPGRDYDSETVFKFI